MVQKVVLANWEFWNWWLQSQMKNKHLMTAKSQDTTHTWWLQSHKTEHTPDDCKVTRQNKYLIAEIWPSAKQLQWKYHYLRSLVHYRCFSSSACFEVFSSSACFQAITKRNDFAVTCQKEMTLQSLVIDLAQVEFPNISSKHIKKSSHI